jgi:hypothetical protein
MEWQSLNQKRSTRFERDKTEASGTVRHTIMLGPRRPRTWTRRLTSRADETLVR